MIGKLNLPAHLQPGSTPILVANPVKSLRQNRLAWTSSEILPVMPFPPPDPAPASPPWHPICHCGWSALHVIQAIGNRLQRQTLLAHRCRQLRNPFGMAICA
jgi:hypothetical protein